MICGQWRFMKYFLYSIKLGFCNKELTANSIINICCVPTERIILRDSNFNSLKHKVSLNTVKSIWSYKLYPLA